VRDRWWSSADPVRRHTGSVGVENGAEGGGLNQ
jgi:hypothetical protein